MIKIVIANHKHNNPTKHKRQDQSNMPGICSGWWWSFRCQWNELRDLGTPSACSGYHSLQAGKEGRPQPVRHGTNHLGVLEVVCSAVQSKQVENPTTGAS